MRALDGGQSPETLPAGHRNGHAAPREGLQNSDNEENGWMNDLKKLIREVPDYPKPGILFYDLTTLLKDKRGFHTLIDRLCEHYNGHTIDVVAGIEARGFILLRLWRTALAPVLFPFENRRSSPRKPPVSPIPWNTARMRLKSTKTPSSPANA